MFVQQIVIGVGAAIGSVAAFLPKLIAFIVVFFIGYLIAKLVEKAIDAALERVGFDRLVERGGVRKVLSKSRYDASSLLSKVVYYVIMLFVLQLSFGIFGPNPVSAMINRVVFYLPNVFAAGLILIIGAAIAAAIADLVKAATGTLPYGTALATASSVAILVVTGFAAADQLNIAPAIVIGLFYAMLAVVVGILVVALGGAGIQPMREYWSRFLVRLEQEAPRVADQAAQAPTAVQDRVEERTRQAREGMSAAV